MVGEVHVKSGALIQIILGLLEMGDYPSARLGRRVKLCLDGLDGAAMMLSSDVVHAYVRYIPLVEYSQ